MSAIPDANPVRPLDPEPTDPAAGATASAAEGPRWRKGGEAVLSGTAVLLFLISAAWLTHSLLAGGNSGGAADSAAGVSADRWAPQLLLCLAVLLAAVGSALRSYRRWSDPTRRLCALLPQIQAGEMPIASLGDVGGGLAPLVPLLRDLFGDLRRQRGEMRKLEQEIRQRVASRTDALEREMGSLRQKAARDALTGLYNRRMLDECLPRLIERRKAARLAARAARAAQSGRSSAHADTRHLNGRPGPAGRDAQDGPDGLCLLMIDVDHFKLLNDTLGHAAGDELLRSIGQLIRSSIRDSDMAFRCGGDEFVVLLDGCGDDAGRLLAGRLVSLVDALARPLRVPRPPRLSIGVSQLSDVKDLTPQALLEEADRLLYEVKGARKAAERAAGRAISR